MAIHQRPEIFWAAMVLDGMFETFPGLRGASVEEGAMWVVPWIRRLDRAMQFAKTEPPLRALTSSRASTCTTTCASRRSPASPSGG